MPTNPPDSPRDDLEEDRARLLALVGSGLAVGALAGLVGSAFNVALAAAERFRGFLVDWAHGYPGVGWLVPVVVAAGAAFLARWLVREPKSREIEDADPVLATERGDDVVPVDAARGKAMHEQQRYWQTVC